jgi:hypothetical protein
MRVVEQITNITCNLRVHVKHHAEAEMTNLYPIFDLRLSDTAHQALSFMQEGQPS